MTDTEQFSDTQIANSARLECAFPNQNDEVVAVYPLRYALAQHRSNTDLSVIFPSISQCDSKIAADASTSNQRDLIAKQLQLNPVGYPVLLGDLEYCRQILRAGWLYIRVEGSSAGKPIWHEYEVLENGTFKKCHWSKEDSVSNQRPANTAAVDFLEFEKGTLVELCYSPVQWSQAKYKEFYDSAERRAKRMQFVDTLSLADTGVAEDCVSAENLSLLVEHFPLQQSDRLKKKMLSKTKHIYSICLHDGVSITASISDRYQSALDELIGYAEENQHKQEIAALVDSVLEKRSKFDKHIDKPSLQQHKELYSYQSGSKNSIVYNYGYNLKLWYEVRGPYGFYEALDDFDLNLESQFLDAEMLIASTLENTEHHPSGVVLLQEQFEKKDTASQKVVLAGKLATEPLSKLLEKLVVLDLPPTRLEIIISTIKLRLGIEILKKTVPAIEYFNLLTGVIKGKSVQIGMALLPKVTSVEYIDVYVFKQRVDYIDIPGRRETFLITSEFEEYIDVTNIPDSVNAAWLKFVAPVALWLNVLTLRATIKQFKLNYAESANLLSNVIQTGMVLGSLVKMGKDKFEVIEKTLDVTKVSKVTGTLAKKLTFITAQKLNVFTAVLDGFYNISKRQEALANHDDAAWGYGFSVGGAVLSGGSVAVTLIFGVAAAPVALFMVVAGTIIGIGGALYATFTENAPIENWLNLCCFGKHRYDGILKINHYEIDSADWEKSKLLEIESFYRALMPYAFEASWKKSKYIFQGNRIKIDISIPNFRLLSSAFELSIVFTNDDGSLVVCSKNSRITSEYKYHHTSAQKESAVDTVIGDLTLNGGFEDDFTLEWLIENEAKLSTYANATVVFKYMPNKDEGLVVPNDSGDLIHLSIDEQSDVCKGYLPIRN